MSQSTAKRGERLIASRPFRYTTAMIIDLLIASATFVAAYVTVVTVRADFPWRDLAFNTLAFVGLAAISLTLFRVYRGAWRYFSIPDLLALMKASVVAVVAYTVLAFITTRGEFLPRSLPILVALYMIGGLSGARLVFRLLVERGFSFGSEVKARSSARKVLLCGFSDKAESFIRSTRRNRGKGVEIAGILDDSELNVGRYVQGVRVLGPLSGLRTILKSFRRNDIEIAEIIVTEMNAGPKRLAEILEAASALSIKVSRIPDLAETSMVTSGSLLAPRPILLGDLLERPEVNADIQSVAGLIEGKVVLVTGAGGSIGSELCRQIASFHPELFIICDNSEFLLYCLDTELRDERPGLNIVTRILDVRDGERVRRMFAELKPEVVFHAAALKHVPLVEANPLEAIKTNVLGTRNVADAALANGAAGFVMISTDKAVNPTSVMGASKRAAEAYCQSLDVDSTTTRFKTVRFGNVLGSNGSVVPRFSEQIAGGGPVTVTHPDIKRYFMTIPEAVRLVLHASAHALRIRTQRGKIMVLDMGEPVRIVDLAERMIQLAGFKPYEDIDIVFTGLRPGEKLEEELFDPSEIQDAALEDGYRVASPRVTDKILLQRTLSQIEACAATEDVERVMRLLLHMVPEYRWPGAKASQPTDTADHLPILGT